MKSKGFVIPVPKGDGFIHSLFLQTMAQFSPRMLNTDIEDEQNMKFSSANFSPGQSSLSPGRLSGNTSPSRLPQNAPEPSESSMYVLFSSCESAN